MNVFCRSTTKLRHFANVCKEHSQVRHYKGRHVRPSLIDFNERQKKIDTSKDLFNESKHYRRALFADWSYDSELFALGARLRESFDSELLREAFRDPSFYCVPQKEKIDVSLSSAVESNVRLAESGEKLVRDHLDAFLRESFPKVPEEGISAILEHLMSAPVLAFLALHIGLKDLLVAEEYPPNRSSLVNAFHALIGAHAESGNDSMQTQQLVVDLVAVQLVGVDLHDIWKITNPMEMLAGYLGSEGIPEPRLQWVSGRNTVLASYHVGIYSKQTLIGECTGESVGIATELAAIDALRRIFDTDVSKRNIDFRVSIPIIEDRPRWSQK
uniref:Large ribosomal subunit protein mL44 n=1 Tax=Caligus clemensi TaxID=344056 RepID=C1C335_CALCM|nr:39S ribosomal protein L44, mitochondrial precursor [Caligus clemensi]